MTQLLLVLPRLQGSHRYQSTQAPQLCKCWWPWVRLLSGWVSFTGIQGCRPRLAFLKFFPICTKLAKGRREDRIHTDLSWSLEKSIQHPVDLTFCVFSLSLWASWNHHISYYLFAFLLSQNPSSSSTSYPPSKLKPDVLLYDVILILSTVFPILPLSFSTPCRWSCPCSSNLQGICSMLRRWQATFHWAFWPRCHPILCIYQSLCQSWMW